MAVPESPVIPPRYGIWQLSFSLLLPEGRKFPNWIIRPRDPETRRRHNGFEPGHEIEKRLEKAADCLKTIFLARAPEGDLHCKWRQLWDRDSPPCD